MEVNVAGAGAGKTTLMSNQITSILIPEGKVVFCIAFTNAAADIIIKKVEEKYGVVPDNIRISTIHSFLHQELIKPYYYFLYGKQYERISVIDLPCKDAYKSKKLSELEKDNILHFTKIPERAKWVAYKKSSDKKGIKNLREKILKRFSDYCEAIFVDEAQDICEDVRHILESLDEAGVRIILYGDPKQDVKGRKQFREIMDKASSIRYISNCHRCPQKHLNISNILASEQERQIADKENAEGSIELIFESDVNIQEFLNTGAYGLKYISKKSERFDTHEKKEIGDKRFETLLYEVHRAMKDKWIDQKTEIEIEREAFYETELMLDAFNGKNTNSVINNAITDGAFDRLENGRYAQMASAFCCEDDRKACVPVVSSIEIIKGREAERCLFILTEDLAPYLFRDKTEDNRMSHLLYVALTRSLDHMTILIEEEVEAKYSRERIERFFRENG